MGERIHLTANYPPMSVPLKPDLTARKMLQLNKDRAQHERLCHGSLGLVGSLLNFYTF